MPIPYILSQSSGLPKQSKINRSSSPNFFASLKKTKMASKKFEALLMISISHVCVAERKVNQNNMVNVCDRAGMKEDLTTVPIMLSDINEIENTIPLTETSYLDSIRIPYRTVPSGNVT